MPQDVPAILTVSADAAARRQGADGCEEEFEFSFAVDLLLDSLQRLHLAGWSSPADAPTPGDPRSAHDDA